MQASAEKGAQVVVLPEMWNCPYSNDSFPVYAEDIKGGNSKSFDTMQGLAKDLSIVLIAGSIPEQEGEKLYNTSCIFDADGSLLGCHRFALDSFLGCVHGQWHGGSSAQLSYVIQLHPQE